MYNFSNNLYGGSNNNRYQEEDPSHTSGRIQRGSGHFHQKNNKLKNKDEVFGRCRWQDPRGRKKEWRPVHNKACQSGHGIEDGS